MELRNIVMNFIIAGRDTTACALSWQFMHLLQDDSILSKLKKEVESVTSGNLEDMNHEEAFEKITKKMPYLNAVAKETLRLHPSVPKNVKFAVKDDVLPDGTKVPAGIAVIWSPYAMGRNPNIWENPLKYDPMRWFEDGNFDKPKKASTATYPAFHMMPRLCLGKPLAEMEIALLTAILVSRYEFKSVGPISDEFASTLTLPMKNGLVVKASKRGGVGETKKSDTK